MQIRSKCDALVKALKLASASFPFRIFLFNQQNKPFLLLLLLLLFLFFFCCCCCFMQILTMEFRRPPEEMGTAIWKGLGSKKVEKFPDWSPLEFYWNFQFQTSRSFLKVFHPREWRSDTKREWNFFFFSQVGDCATKVLSALTMD